MSAIKPLPENAGLAFVGEPAWPAGVINDSEVESFRNTTNPSAKPNSDVIRGFVGVSSGHSHQRWQIDFPAHFSEVETNLYHDPAALLRQRTNAPEFSAQWWLNPHAEPRLRVALGRLDRYLVTLRPGPRVTPTPAWAWAETRWLPDETLIAIARDDDFMHGILQSREFSVWWQEFFNSETPTFAFDTFPFPWSPITPLGSLTAMQQDLRYNVVNAVRKEDGDALIHAVSSAYGWPTSFTDADILLRLQETNQRRTAPKTYVPW